MNTVYAAEHGGGATLVEGEEARLRWWQSTRGKINELIKF